MAQKEWALKNKKKNDKPPKKSVANGSAGDAIPVDDEVWDVPSDDEPPREPASKVPKTDNDKEGKQAAREAAKLEKQLEMAWHKEIGKAAKLIGSLNTVTKALANAKTRTSKNEEFFEIQMLDGINDALTKLTGLKDRSVAAKQNLLCKSIRMPLQRCLRFHVFHAPHWSLNQIYMFYIHLRD